MTNFLENRQGIIKKIRLKLFVHLTTLNRMVVRWERWILRTKVIPILDALQSLNIQH